MVNEETYRIYVTDSLQIAPQGKYKAGRYYDIVSGKKQDERSGDEVFEDVVKRGGLEIA